MSNENIDLSLVSKKIVKGSEREDSGRYSLLVVEDDLGLFTVLNRIIKDVHPDFKLKWVTTATEALKEINQSQLEEGKNYDLILSDLLLSNLELGTDVWKHCKIHCPETPFLMMSGVDTGTYFRMIEQDGNPPYFLPKPFSVENCKTTIELLLLGQTSTFSCS